MPESGFNNGSKNSKNSRGEEDYLSPYHTLPLPLQFIHYIVLYEMVYLHSHPLSIMPMLLFINIVGR